MGATETILIPPYGHTLAGTLRAINANAIASRIELAPQSPFAGDPEFDSSSLAAWTTLNGANADTLDANTVKSRLRINLNATNSDWYDGVRTGPFLYQVISGNFDVYTKVEIGTHADYHSVRIHAQSTSDARDWISVGILAQSVAPQVRLIYESTVNDATTLGVDTAAAANTRTTGGAVYFRLKRTSNDFAGYVSYDGVNWTTLTTVTRADFSSDARLGACCGTGGSTANSLEVAWDFLRSWPPYVTTSPVSTLVLDSGANGTTWTPSTFAALENPPLDPFGIQDTIGRGTLKYRLAASDTNPPTLAGGTLTEAQVQALAVITGRYLHIEVTYISANGYELAAFAGAKIQRTINLGAARLVNGGLVG